MLELAGIAVILLLLVLILVVVACWISLNNQCRKCKTHLALLEARVETGLASLRSEQQMVRTKAFLQIASSRLAERLPDGTAKVMVWDKEPHLELPAKGWTRAPSSLDQSMVVGWTVPFTGTYRLGFCAAPLMAEAVVAMVVNGQPLQRSTISGTSQSSKNFLVNLARGDVLSFLVLNHYSEQLESTLSAELLDLGGKAQDPAADALPAQKNVRTLERWIEHNSALLQQRPSVTTLFQRSA